MYHEIRMFINVKSIKNENLYLYGYLTDPIFWMIDTYTDDLTDWPPAGIISNYFWMFCELEIMNTWIHNNR